MKVSIALHSEFPNEAGNQRQFETSYGGYNRQYADLDVIPETGNGVVQFPLCVFPPVNSDPEVARFFSIGMAHAPEGYGGDIQVAGPCNPPIEMIIGGEPTLTGVGAGIYAERLKERGCIKQNEAGEWVELTEHELRNRPIPQS